jgi:Leucine-rich repeat (LRR) protein
MTDAAPCPDQGSLEQFLIGQTPEPEALRLERHLAECRACLGRAASLHPRDLLIEAVHAGAGPVLATPVDDRLIEQLCGLRRAAGAESLETTTGDAPAGEHLVDATEEAYDFLAPPRAEGELGWLGPYRVLKVLGAGGMGVVFAAEDSRLRRPVALKVLRPGLAASARARQRFLREAQAAAAIEHDHIVTVYHVDEDRGFPYLAMPILRGESLEDRLKREGRLPIPEVFRIGREIAEGLAAAHRRGLIHRDIKPGNIWLEAGGRVKIVDFGLARAVEGDAQLTGSGYVVGTPAYMAPEQAMGQEVSPRADLFSLGVVLYRLCTGRLPFPGKTSLEVMRSLATQEPRAVGEENAAVAPALAELVMRLLAKDPAARPASAVEVASQLHALARSPRLGPAPAAAPTSSASKSPGSDRTAGRGRGAGWKRRGLVAAGMALAAMLPLGYFFGGVLIRFATNKGVLLVQVNDPKVEVAVKRNGILVQDLTTRREFVLTAGNGEIEVYEKASGLRLATKRFTLTRGGKETVTVELPRPPKAAKKEPNPPLVQKAGEADRRAAEWILSIGGVLSLRTHDKTLDIDALNKLPVEEFRLVDIDLFRSRQLTDAGLEHLAGLSDVTNLRLLETPVTDAGLARLRALPKLYRLDLQGTKVTDAGLAHLRAFPNLCILSLQGTKVTDAGLPHLKDRFQLAMLSLRDTAVGDAGLAYVKALPNLWSLDLSGTRVTDAGLVHWNATSSLQQLMLQNTAITDNGLAHLKNLPKLRELSLSDTRVTDKGLVHLTAMPQLDSLWLDGTRVTDGGLAHLKAVPQLRLLSLLYTSVTDRGLSQLKKVPQLTTLRLGATRVTDAGLVQLKAVPQLTALVLGPSRVTDAGLACLHVLNSLSTLDLGGTRVSDAGLPQLIHFSKLSVLTLDGARLSVKGLATLKAALPNTRITWSEPNAGAANAVLALGGVVHVRVKGRAADQLVKAIADLPLEYFQVTRVNLGGSNKPLGDLLPTLASLKDPEFDRLRALDLSGTRVTDGDLEKLKPLTGLRELLLARTKVTDNGLAHVRTLKGLSRLVLDGSLISGGEIASLKDMPALTDLCIGCPAITDLFAEQIGAVKRLEHLSLAGSSLGDEGLKHLHSLTNLKKLDLSGSKVTEEGVTALRKALPKCQVVFKTAGK